MRVINSTFWMKLNIILQILIFYILSFRSSWYFVFCIPWGTGPYLSAQSRTQETGKVETTGCGLTQRKTFLLHSLTCELNIQAYTKEEIVSNMDLKRQNIQLGPVSGYNLTTKGICPHKNHLQQSRVKLHGRQQCGTKMVREIIIYLTLRRLQLAQS